MTQHHLAVVFGLLVAIASSPPKLQANEPNSLERASLESALIQCRMRQLGLILAREAYLAHAHTLQGQPEKRAMVEYYQALTEVELGDHRAAAKSFSSVADAIPSGHLLSDKSIAWAKMLAGGKAVSREEPDDELIWHCRITATLHPERPRPLPRTPRSNEELLDAAAALARYVDAEPFLDLATQVPLEPSTTLWLEGIEDRQKDVKYSLYDPALFTIEAAAAVQRLMNQINELETPESELVRIWCYLLQQRPHQAMKQIDMLQSSPTVRTISPEQQSELACLALAASSLAGMRDRKEIWKNEVKATELLPLWGVRALNLIVATDPWVLEEIHRSLQTLLEGRDPFSPGLLHPRAKSDLENSERLRSHYWEIGWAYRCRHVGSCGHRILSDGPPENDAMRAFRLMQHLDSPICRSTQHDIRPLQFVLLADASSRCRELELWQNKLRPPLVEEFPSLSIVQHLARVVAGEVRAGQGTVVYNQRGQQVELPDELLLGVATGVSFKTNSSSGVRRYSWGIVVAVFLCVIAAVTGLVVWQRRSMR